ncbi:kynureninase [Achromobacter xylosoxidans]|uniref:kynureninase n=1 Tax=Alcaligenes xylosoxydans xylosoxydans TaxID=85698 RepID=UPI0003D68DF8|nr:kynureninase [Achromobacter xylosoxidans]AHC49512.1 Kynureninase [Achromobacter xylosoxidans NBRC 15126 = ATCC 27061]OFL44641.1 kynureninase [Achromobacter xylosoxidans]OFS48553.1 kynureninase [Achromobacter xylosoxidans]QKQ53766.1 kynureninase [Achromobacter xylosoxidans]QPR97085.1 kynureninase [Achromobacter xylosoxidans]
MNTREACVAADRQDPLAPLKARFDLPPGVLYMDGNSLGVMPRAAAARAAEVITQEWGTGLIRSWNTAGWFELPSRLGDKLAGLLGAKAGELVITDTTSLNIFKALAASLRIQQKRQPKRRVILSERDNFPTDLYMIQGMIDLLQQGYEMRLIDDELPLDRALDEDVAVVLLSHVNYRSGQMHDMAAVTRQAHERGALVIWDLAHAAGAVPVDLNGADADYAVGCTYKYLNGGPGSPAFIWVAPRHIPDFWQPLSGWWGHQRPFDMTVAYEPAGGIRRYLCGTQPIVSLAMVECGLDVARETDMAEVRRKSLALGDLFIALVEERCAGHPLTLVTPRDHAQRGSHVSLRHPNGYEVMQALIARGLIGDYREPEVLRFGLTPLYFGYADVWDAVEILKDVLDSKAWDKPEFKQRSAVT